MPNSIPGRIVPTATTVNTSATAIPSTAATGRRTIMVFNNGSNTVFLGNADVTAANGFPLEAGASHAFDLEANVVLYGRTSSGSSDVRSLEGV